MKELLKKYLEIVKTKGEDSEEAKAIFAEMVKSEGENEDVEKAVKSALSPLLEKLSEVQKKKHLADAEEDKEEEKEVEEEGKKTFSVITAESRKRNELDLAGSFVKAMIKKDDKKLEEISKKTAMNVTTDSQGGYTVPTILEAGVWSIAEQYGLSLQKATVIPMRSATHDLTTDATDVTVKKISEGNSIDPSEPTFGRKQLQAIDYVGALAVSSLQLLEDSNVNVANYVIEKFGKAFGLYMDKNAFKGDDYEGVLTASGTTAYVMGSTNYLTLTPDDLSAMIDSLSSGELTNAEFYFDKKIAGILRTLKDSAGNYIYQPATAKDPAMVFGYPVNFVGDAVLPSAPSSNTKFGFLGNMKHFAIGRREGLRIDVSDSYKFNTAQMTWRALQRFDMKAIIPGAFVTIATKA